MAKGKALVAKLRAQPKTRDAEALAAWIGRFKKLRNAGVSNKKAKSLAGKQGGLKEGGVGGGSGGSNGGGNTPPGGGENSNGKSLKSVLGYDPYSKDTPQHLRVHGRPNNEPKILDKDEIVNMDFDEIRKNDKSIQYMQSVDRGEKIFGGSRSGDKRPSAALRIAGLETSIKDEKEKPNPKLGNIQEMRGRQQKLAAEAGIPGYDKANFDDPKPKAPAVSNSTVKPSSKYEGLGPKDRKLIAVVKKKPALLASTISTYENLSKNGSPVAKARAKDMLAELRKLRSAGSK